MFQSKLSREDKNVIIGLGVLVVLWLIMGACLYLGAVPWLSSWIELFNGATWPADWRDMYKQMPLGFALTVSFRFFINMASLIGIGWIVWDLLSKERQNIMKFTKMLDTRDAIITNEIIHDLNVSEENEEKVEAAVKSAGKRWMDMHLPNLVGEKAARKIIEEEYGD